MRLTSEQFERLLLALARRSGGGGGGVHGDLDERRSEPRVPADGVVVMTPENANGIPIHARLRNLSRGGLGFSHHSSLPRGRRMTLRLPGWGGDDDPEQLRCEVRHCELTGEDMFTIGVSFLD
jgi:hypothetical protein